MKRASAWIGVALLALAALATVSWTSGATVRLTDEAGAPASGAYVRYHYDGSLINPVHPVTYIARGSVIARADADGSVRIPGRIHFRPALPLSMPPRLFIDHVYVPRLHNAFGPLGVGTTTQPGVFVADEGREQVSVVDVSTDPDRWERSLGQLFDCIRETLSRGGSKAAAPDDVQTLAHARELITHLRTEYAAFLARFGQAARRRPPAPPGGSERDRQSWQEQTDAQLAREPLWGPFLERTWRSRLLEFDMLEQSLR